MAVRTLARQSTSPQEWKKLQIKSPTGKALPGLEKQITKRQNQEAFNALPKPVQDVLTKEAEAQFATKVFKYARTLPNFPKPELQRLRRKAFNQRQNAQGMKLRLAEGSTDINAKSPIIGLDKKGKINRIGPDPRLTANSIDNIISDLIPDQPWEIAVAAGTRGIGTVGSAAGRTAVEAAGRVLPKAGRVARVVAGVGRARQAVRGAAAAAAEGIGTRTGATAARAAARAGAERVTAQVPKVVRRGATTGAKAATYPIRRPGRTALGASAASAYVQLASGKSVKDVNISASALSPVVRQVTSVVPKGVGKNFLTDLIELPLSVVPSIYLTGDALVQAAGGNQTKLDAMVKDYIDNGFLPNVIRFAATQDPKYWVDARRSFENHPLYAALEVSGTYALVGRGAGTLLRRGALGKKGKQLASLERPDLQLGNGFSERQRYSANVLTKGAQIAAETRKAKKGMNPFDVASKRDIASRIVPKTQIGEVKPIRDRKLERIMVDLEAGREGSRRVKRDRALMAEGTKKHLYFAIPKRVEPVWTLVLEEGIRSAKTWRKDLRELKDSSTQTAQVARAEGRWTPDMEKQHVQSIKRIDKALKRATDADVIKAIGLKAQFVKAQKIRAKELDKQGGAYSLNEYERSRLVPRAIRDLGARVDPEYEWIISNGKGKYKNKTFRSKEAARRFAQKEMKLKNPIVLAKDALVDANGRKYTLKRLQAEAKKRGWDPGFVSQSPGFGDRRGSWYQPAIPQTGRPSPMKTKSRTGQASAALTYDISAKPAITQIAHERTFIDSPTGFDRMAKEISGRNAEGQTARFKRYDEASRAALNPEAYGLSPDIKWTPMRIVRAGSRKAERDAAQRSLQAADEAMRSEANNAMSESLRELDSQILTGMLTGAGKGDWVLVPEVMANAAKRLLTNKVPMGWQQANTLFKKAVLPLSPKWLLGNVIEPQIRMILTGETPFDAMVGKFLIAAYRTFDPAGASEFESKTVGGTNYASVNRYANRRVVTDNLNAWSQLAKTPTVVALKDVVDSYIAMTFKASTAVERYPQYAALGKEARIRMGEMGFTWRDALNKQSTAYEQLARGLSDTAEQRAYARAIERAHGAYLRLNSTERALFADFMPFGLWYRSAITFVGYTLPRHHPIKVAVGVGLAQMTEQDRQKLGLSLTVEKRLPNYLLGSVPLPNGSILKVNSYTSFGMFAGLAQNLAGGPTPLVQVLTDSLSGLDWLGNKLVRPSDGKPLSDAEYIMLAASNLAEASLPLAGALYRLFFGKSMGQTFAVPPYQMKKDPTGKRLLNWAGWQTEDKKSQQSAIKYRVSTPLSVPGAADVGQKKPKKSSGSSGSSDKYGLDYFLK